MRDIALFFMWTGLYALGAATTAFVSLTVFDYGWQRDYQGTKTGKIDDLWFPFVVALWPFAVLFLPVVVVVRLAKKVSGP